MEEIFRYVLFCAGIIAVLSLYDHFKGKRRSAESKSVEPKPVEKKKTSFVTHADQDRVVEELRKKNTDPNVDWEWVRDSILWTGSGLDMDSDPEDVQAAIDLEK